MKLTELDTPSLLIDRDKLIRNIARAKASCAKLGVHWRPHLKTHKCLEIARLQIEDPTGPATVSTLKEAEFFASNGITDLIYAVGIAPHKLPRVDRINKSGADCKIILDSVEAADAVSRYARTAGTSFRVLIEIDCDGHRSGLKPGSPEILEVARHLKDGVALVGVLTHAGGSYSAHGDAELKAAAENEVTAITRVADDLRAAGFPIEIVSVGSTPTLCAAEKAPGVTEYRSGVGTIFDLFMHGVGVCEIGDIAESVLVSVIGRQQEKGWLITDGGWLAMSRDRGTASQAVDWGYGAVCDINGNLIPELWVASANQEHGIIARRDGKPISESDFPLDTRLRILPNHACPTAAAFDRYHIVDHGEATEVWHRINNWSNL